MGIPKSLKIGTFQYRVTTDESALRAKDHEMNGPFAGYGDHDQEVIGINANISPRKQAETLLHETLHAVFETVGGLPSRGEEEDDHDYEERLINALSPTLFGVLRENPKLLDYIKEA